MGETMDVPECLDKDLMSNMQTVYARTFRAGWIAGMVRPLRLEDLCCSEEQRPVECVYYCLSMILLSMKAKAGAEVAKQILFGFKSP